MRGENGHGPDFLEQDGGTSPRARGKHRQVYIKPNIIRNIPACAGKTCLNLHAWWGVAEHPRVRGENRRSRGAGGRCRGTSPRARGKLHRDWRVHENQRNIPACAGKTKSCTPAFPVPEEHPRVRGENACTTSHATPPVRNIPACAGKTFGFKLHVCYIQEHPRVRGENVKS